MVSQLYQMLEKSGDAIPVACFIPVPGIPETPMSVSELCTLPIKPYSKESALRNLSTTTGFKIDHDPGMVARAVVSIRDDEVFQSTWANQTLASWSSIETGRKYNPCLRPPTRPDLSVFLKEALMQPAGELLQGQKLRVAASIGCEEPSIHGGPYSKSPDPSFDSVIVCAFVQKIESKLGNASPYLVGMIVDDFDYRALVALDGVDFTAKGRFKGNSIDSIPAHTRQQRRKHFEAEETLLLKVCSIAIEFNLSYFMIANWSGAVFIRIGNDSITVGPQVPFKRPDPSSICSKGAAPPTPPPSSPDLLCPPSSSATPSSSSPPSAASGSSQPTQYSLLLSLTALAHVSFQEKIWEPDYRWATLPWSRRLDKPPKRAASSGTFEEASRKKARRLPPSPVEDPAEAVSPVLLEPVGVRNV